MHSSSFSLLSLLQRASSRFFVLMIVFVAAPLFAQTDVPAATVQARSADEFVGSMGINVHVEYPDLPYSNYGLVNSSLESLGMRHIRDEMNQADPNFGNTAFVGEILAIGKLNYTVCGVIEGGNDYPWPAGSSRLKASNVIDMITNLDSVVDAVEGPNEPDNPTPPFVYDGVCPKIGANTACYPDGAIQEQEDLWHIVKHSKLASEQIKKLPVLGMSEESPQDFFTLVKASSSPFPQASYGNMHAYQNGLWADWDLKSVYIPDAQAWTGAKKALWTTEMGYHNYTKFLDNGEQQGVSEGAAAIYLPIAFLSGFNNNVERTFSYELLDEVNDPQLDHKCGVSSPSTGINYCSGEGHYGILNYDGSAKPAFTALQHLIEILSDSGTKGFTPGKLDIRFSNAPAKMGYSLLQKSDGDYYLAIWNDEQIYAPATSATNPGHDIGWKNVPVTIRFCMPRSFTVYAPNDDSGANPTSAYTLATTSDSIEIDLPAKVLVIKIVGTS